MKKIELLVLMTPALRQKGREEKNKSLSIDDNSLISIKQANETNQNLKRLSSQF